MFKQMLGGFSNAANQLLSQVAAELPKVTPDTRKLMRPEVVDPFYGLSAEEREHILMVQRRADEASRSAMTVPPAKVVSKAVEEEVSSPLLDVESNEDEADVSSNVSTVRQASKADEVTDEDHESIYSGSSETGGADNLSEDEQSNGSGDLSDNAVLTEEENFQPTVSQPAPIQGMEHLSEDEKQPILQVMAKDEDFFEDTPSPEDKFSELSAPVKQLSFERPGSLEKQPTIVIYSPSSSSQLTPDEENESRPEEDIIQPSPFPDIETTEHFISDATTTKASETFPPEHELSSDIIPERPTSASSSSALEDIGKSMRVIQRQRCSSLPVEHDKEYQALIGKPERRASDFLAFEYDEAADPTVTDAEEEVLDTMQTNISHSEHIEQCLPSQSRLYLVNPPTEDADDLTKSDHPRHEPTPSMDQKHDAIGQEVYATGGIYPIEPEEQKHQQTPADFQPQPIVTVSQTVPAGTTSTPSEAIVEPGPVASMTPEFSRRVERRVDLTESPASNQFSFPSSKAAMSSFKVSFGGLFNKTKTDLTSLASTVRNRTEAALKRASDSMTSGLTTSGSMPGDLSSRAMEMSGTERPHSTSLSASPTEADYKQFGYSETSVANDSMRQMKPITSQWKTDQPVSANRKAESHQSATASSTSYTSDSTEDTGYGSRCSSADEFYRFASDGAQYFATYENSRPVSVDQLKLSSANGQRINPFLEEAKLATAAKGDLDFEPSDVKIEELPMDSERFSRLSDHSTFSTHQKSLPEYHQPSDVDHGHTNMQMYDSSEVSDEEEENRIKEIESEFVFHSEEPDTTPIGDWQMCPLCQMNEIHMHADGTTLTGQLCANCGFTVCSKCGGVQTMNQKTVWLCSLCQATIRSQTKLPISVEHIEKHKIAKPSEDSDEESNNDSGDDDDSYPDVVLEVPTSPVKVESMDDSQMASECSKEQFQVFRDIERCFQGSYDDFTTDEDQKKSKPESQASTDKTDRGNKKSLKSSDASTEPRKPLSIGEEIFGQIAENLDSPSQPEDVVDYAQAMRYYTSQPLYVHRPGPVYTIVEENEESAETEALNRANSRAGKNRMKDAQEKKQKMQLKSEQQAESVTSQPLLPGREGTAKEMEEKDDQSTEVTSPKPIRIAPPPPHKGELTVEKPAPPGSIEHKEKAAPTLQGVAAFEATRPARTRSDVSGSYPLFPDRSSAEPATTTQPQKKQWTQNDEVDSDFFGDKYLTSFGRLTAETQYSSKKRENNSGDMRTAESGASAEQSECDEVFVSRLKRSPAMILSGIKDDPEGDRLPTTAPPQSAYADSFTDAALSKADTQVSSVEGRANAKKFINDQSAASVAAAAASADMGRRKLPSVPPTYGRYQFSPTEQGVLRWQNTKRPTPMAGSYSSIPSDWSRVSQPYPTPHTAASKAAVPKKALPPTLARVLLKQELKEALQKRIERLEASEIEANHRDFVIKRYLSTGVYPKSVGIDSAPRVVRSSLPPELIKGCLVTFNRLDKVQPMPKRMEMTSQAEQRQLEILNRLSELERITGRTMERMTTSVGTSASPVYTRFGKINTGTQTAAFSEFKDVQTQTGLEKDAFVQSCLEGNAGRSKTVAIGTTDFKLYRTASTNTEDFDDFEPEDDLWSRERRRSRIRREIDRRRQKFSSCEDLTAYSREPYYDDYGLPMHTFQEQPARRPNYQSNLFRYCSLPRMDLPYDYSPRRDLYYSMDRSHAYPESGAYQKMWMKNDPIAISSQNAWPPGRHMPYGDGRSYLSQSLPYLDSQPELIGSNREPTFCESRWRNRAEEPLRRTSPSFLSQYVNYLHNDFLSHPSAVNDYGYRSDSSPPSAPVNPHYDVQEDLLGLTQLPSRYGRYIEPVESVPPSALCAANDLDRKAGSAIRFDEQYPMERSQMTFEEPYAYPYTKRTKAYGSKVHGQASDESRYTAKYGTRNPRTTAQQPAYPEVKNPMSTTGAGAYGRRTDDVRQKQSIAASSTLHKQNNSRLLGNGQIRRLLLVRDQKDRSGHGIGMRVIGGKMLPSSDGELVAYVAAVYKGGLVDLMGQVKEGDQILEWNGVPLTGKTYEEVQKIIDNTEGEVEIVIKSDANLNLVYRLEEEESNSLDKGYESDFTASLSHRLSKAHGKMASTAQVVRDERGKASPCFSTTPRTQSPNAQQQVTMTTGSGSIKLRIHFESFTGTLFVTVACAKGLQRLGRKSRIPNPFVKIYLLPNRSVGNKRRTKFIPRSQNPEWNQTVVYKDLTIGTLLGKDLEFTVWSYERFKENVFMGRVMIALEDALRYGPKTFWYPLESTL